MGEVINLRRARKAKARAEAGQAATEARALHGRSKGERISQKAEAERTARLIDGSRIERE